MTNEEAYKGFLSDMGYGEPEQIEIIRIEQSLIPDVIDIMFVDYEGDMMTELISLADIIRYKHDSEYNYEQITREPFSQNEKGRGLWS